MLVMCLLVSRDIAVARYTVCSLADVLKAQAYLLFYERLESERLDYDPPSVFASESRLEADPQSQDPLPPPPPQQQQQAPSRTTATPAVPVDSLAAAPLLDTFTQVSGV